ncbi:FAD-dependent oxidoreductase [Streptomyces sp. NBC_00090]|uniref:FAD-dependent oxidoreductase n=1 Tax=Streptomyces sp. NBC_00090 TaxID=2903619 RepID=UPI0032444872
MESRSKSISRRTALKASGLVAAGTALGMSLPAVAEAADAAKSADADQCVYDTIVIGAGLAGLTAARELRKKGRKVLVIEARNRIGGRTWTDTFNDYEIERGGAWVDPKQPHVWRELSRYALPIVADAGPERVLMPTLSGFAEFDPITAYTRQGELFTPFFDGATNYFPKPYQPFTREDLVTPLDGVTLRDRLNQLAFAPQDEIRMTSTTALYGAPSTRGALTQLAQWWALSGWNYEGFAGINTYRMQGGTKSLANAILADGAPHLVLNSPVSSVTQKNGQVKVLTRTGVTYTATEVIMAVPVNVWKKITFSPALPTAYRDATTQGYGVPRQKKLWLDLTNPTDRFIAEAPEGYGITIMGRMNDNAPVVAFTVDPTLDVTSHAQVEAAVKQIMPQASLRSFTVTDWQAEEFSLGGPAFRQPYQLTRLHRAISQPFGKVKFAGDDLALGWSGYMDGAIESGLRVAGSPTLSPLPAAAPNNRGLVGPEADRRIYRSMIGL